ncbi:hypothetical protein ACVWWJ_002299 [Luteibacter sp. HA06]
MVSARRDDIDAKCHFDVLDCLHKKCMELLVELVKANGLFERCAVLKIFPNDTAQSSVKARQDLSFSKRVPISAEPVVAELPQICECGGLIANVQASCF